MIDWQRVQELRDEIGAADFAEVVELFLEEADEVAKRLIAKQPPTDIEAALHFLKGSALNLGFNDLATLCQIGEKAAASGQAHKVDLAEVARIYAVSKARFLADRKTQNAA